MHRLLGTALLVVALLTACDGAWRAGGGPAELTARAVAAVMLDHLPNDTSTREAALVDETSPPIVMAPSARTWARARP